MKKVLSILIAAIILFTVFALSHFYNNESKKDFSVISFENRSFNLEVVRSLNSKAKGLSGRGSLEKGKGMLFVFEENGFHGIWMKEMNFPIDIIWLDENFKVTGLKEKALPSDFPEVYRPDSPARFVLEINAEEAREAGIKIGSEAEIF